MTSTRTRRHLRTRQAILDAARDIIANEGIHALSMRALADSIDYSAAGLYEYFASKEEIVATVCEEGQRFLYEAMSQVNPDLPPAEYVYGLGVSYIRFALEYPDYFLVMFTEGPPPDDGEGGDATGQEDCAQQDSAQQDDADKEGSAYGILLRGVQRGIDEGVFPLRSGFGRDEIAYAAWTLVHGIAMLRITALRDIDTDLDRADHQALVNFMRGLRAP